MRSSCIGGQEQEVTDGTVNTEMTENDLTSLHWLHVLSGAALSPPTPPTSPASPLPRFQHRRKTQPTSGGRRSAPLPADVDFRHVNTKPPFSYATLITMAMSDTKQKMSLAHIYRWIRHHFLFYRNAHPNWQNSIRHNLSLNDCFVRVPRDKNEPGKGGYWRFNTCTNSGSVTSSTTACSSRSTYCTGRSTRKRRNNTSRRQQQQQQQQQQHEYVVNNALATTLTNNNNNNALQMSYQLIETKQQQQQQQHQQILQYEQQWTVTPTCSPVDSFSELMLLPSCYTDVQEAPPACHASVPSSAGLMISALNSEQYESAVPTVSTVTDTDSTVSRQLSTLQWELGPVFDDSETVTCCAGEVGMSQLDDAFINIDAVIASF